MAVVLAINSGTPAGAQGAQNCALIPGEPAGMIYLGTNAAGLFAVTR